MDHGWIDGVNADGVRVDSVPEISDERLAELMKHFTPLVMEGDSLHTFDIPHLRNTAFTWSPKNMVKVEKRFHIIKTIHTNHGCGYHGFFKPSIAEVLAHVQGDDLTDSYGDHFYIDPGYIDIYKSGSAQRATTHFGVFE